MKTEVLLGAVTILPNLVGFIMTIYPPNRRRVKELLASLFVVLAVAGMILVLNQSKETESARIDAEKASKRAEEEWRETEAAIQRTEAATQQQLQEVREYAKREKNENSYLLTTMEAMDKTLQLLGKSVTTPELQKQVEQAHKHYVVTMSEHLETTDSIKAQKNPASTQPQK